MRRWAIFLIAALLWNTVKAIIIANIWAFTEYIFTFYYRTALLIVSDHYVINVYNFAII